jgi:meiotically up-regulated gene 157 (Mug157) protein
MSNDELGIVDENSIVLSGEIQKEFLNSSKEQMMEYIFFLVTRVNELEEDLNTSVTTSQLLKELLGTYQNALSDIQETIDEATNSKGFLS